MYVKGHTDTLDLFGITKQARAGMIGRGLRWLGSKMPTWQGVKRFAVGSPRQFLHEAGTGQLWRPGSTVRQGLAAPGLLSKGLLYGLPAIEGVRIMRSAPGDRGERMGGLIGGTLGGLAAWGPGGMLGSMAVGGLGAALGSRAVRAGKHLVGRPSPGPMQQQGYPQQQHGYPQQHPGYGMMPQR